MRKGTVGRLAVACFVALAIAACGKGSDDRQDEQGLVELTPRDAVFGKVQKNNSIVIALLDKAGACAAAQSRTMMRDSTGLTFWLRDLAGQAGPGVYSIWQLSDGVPQAKTALVDLTRTNAVCSDTLTAEQSTPLGGFVTIDAIDPKPGGMAIGHYQIEFAAGTMSGDISATWCELPTDYSPGSLSCQ